MFECIIVFQPKQLVKSPCGSKSTINTSNPCRDKPIATFSVVVLPTPPF